MRGIAPYAARAPYANRSGTRSCWTSESANRVGSVVRAKIAPTEAMATTRKASVRPSATATTVRRTGPTVSSSVAAGSPLLMEKSALNVPIPTAASQSGVNVPRRVTGRMPPTVSPAASAVPARTSGGPGARVSASPASQSNAMPSLSAGLVRPSWLSSWASVGSRRATIMGAPSPLARPARLAVRPRSVGHP